MTIKTLTTTLLLAASLLLFTACDSKVETNAVDEQSPAVQIDTTAIDTGDEGTTGSGSAENNATTETNTATTVNTDGSTETNTTVATNGNTTETNTTVPTANIKSLKLTVGKTSLNREENTTLKVEIIYDDNTAKDVTDQVVWTVTPKDTLKVANNTLITLKDINTTLQAQLGTRVSNSVKLELYWEVRGHKLPPEPDSVQNNATLEGIDSNDNGVRDDVERKIYEKYSKALHVALLMDNARFYQQTIVQPTDKAKKTVRQSIRYVNCQLYLIDLDKDIESDNWRDNPIYVKNETINNLKRVKKYLDYNLALSGGTYGSSPRDWNRDACSLEVIKVLEKLEL